MASIISIMTLHVCLNTYNLILNIDNASEEEMQDFLREIVMLKHVGYHVNVIRLVGCCTTRAPLIALLEHAPRGDLLSLLRSARGRRKLDIQRSSLKKESNLRDRLSEDDCKYYI